MTQMSLSMKQEQSHRHREETGDYQGEGAGGEREWEAGVYRCQLLYLEWINNKVLLYSTENYIQYPIISQSCSVMSNSVTPWTIQSGEFSSPEYWSG